jgi:hypothetical protein
LKITLGRRTLIFKLSMPPLGRRTLIFKLSMLPLGRRTLIFKLSVQTPFLLRNRACVSSASFCPELVHCRV